jgi:hypothetical protein
LEFHHAERLEEMMRAMGGRACSAYEVAGMTTWATGKFENFTPWMQRAAIGETLSHLEYAVSCDMLKRDDVDGVNLYRVVQT